MSPAYHNRQAAGASGSLIGKAAAPAPKAAKKARGRAVFERGVIAHTTYLRRGLEARIAAQRRGA